MTSKGTLRIAPAGKRDIASVRALFAAYAAGLGVDLTPQGFDSEIAGLPGAYAPPRGAILLAFDCRATAMGSVALKPLNVRAGEIKRLYVMPSARGRGVGRKLMEAVLRRARRIGYTEIKLDTLPHMKEAVALYERLGFEPVAPYGSHPYPGLICFGRRLW
ncbi:MAG: GNAT family N-acetyltransferase [Rhizomicrobium sp.]